MCVYVLPQNRATQVTDRAESLESKCDDSQIYEILK